MKKVDQEVLAIISSGIIEGNIFRIMGGQLDRKIYVAVNEVLENMGGKWNRKLGGHLFEEDPTDKIENLIETGESVNEKKLYQFYETPALIVEKMIELAGIKENHSVLEPSAGHGAIATRLLKNDPICLEIDPKKCDVLFSKGLRTACVDFLKYTAQKYDRIVMNPPFTKQQDIDHVLHAYSLLNKGGRLVAIMSPGFIFRQNKKSTEFASLLKDCGRWEFLPEKTFKESGTMIRTVLVILEKSNFSSSVRVR